jgi:hypothetical protein
MVIDLWFQKLMIWNDGCNRFYWNYGGMASVGDSAGAVAFWDDGGRLLEEMLNL